MTLDELVEKLAELRTIHGGEIKIYSEGDWQWELEELKYWEPDPPVTCYRKFMASDELPERIVIT